MRYVTLLSVLVLLFCAALLLGLNACSGASTRVRSQPCRFHHHLHRRSNTLSSSSRRIEPPITFFRIPF